MSKILLLNGPNLNMLGLRETKHYGTERLEDISRKLESIAAKKGFQLTSFHSNAEHELIETIQAALTDAINIIIFNPGAYTHTSIALRDALLSVEIPFIEVHLSNIAQREEFRRVSYFSDIAHGVVCGFGSVSYELALHAAIRKIQLDNTAGR